MKVGTASIEGITITDDLVELSKSTKVLQVPVRDHPGAQDSWIRETQAIDFLGVKYVMPHNDRDGYKNDYFLTLCLIGDHQFGDAKNPDGCLVRPGDLYVVDANVTHWQFGRGTPGDIAKQVETPFLCVQWVCTKGELGNLLSRLANLPQVKLDPNDTDQRYRARVLQALASRHEVSPCRRRELAEV